MNVQNSKFSSLIKVRQYQEKKTQQELSSIRTQKEFEEKHLEVLQKSREVAFGDDNTNEKITAKEIQYSRAFIRSLSHEIDKKGDEVTEITSKESTKLTELVDRTMKKKMIENLDAKQKEIHMLEQQRKETKIIDVLAQRLKNIM